MTRKHIIIFVLLALTAFSAFGQETAANNSVKWGVIGAAFVLGIAAFGGAIGQSRAIAAAVDGIARNPGAAGAIRLSMIIGLALIESLALYVFVIAAILLFVQPGK